jgi:hypothetical protein
MRGETAPGQLSALLEKHPLIISIMEKSRVLTQQFLLTHFSHLIYLLIEKEISKFAPGL